MPALQEAPPKNCPRCVNGAMITERDWYGTYGYCINCGYTHEVLTSPSVNLEADRTVIGLRKRYRQPSHGKLKL